LVQQIGALKIGGHALFLTTSGDVMDGRDVDIVVNRYLFCAFFFNGLLGCLSYNFWAISMVVLTVSVDDLT